MSSVVSETELSVEERLTALESAVGMLQSRLGRAVVDQPAPRGSPKLCANVMGEIREMTAELFRRPIEVESASDPEDGDLQAAFVVKAHHDDIERMVAIQSEWYKRVREKFPDARRAVILTVSYE